MAIQRPIDAQVRARELGIVRIGDKRPTQNGGSRPAMRETFRLTSDQRSILEAVQKVYPGDLREWRDEGKAKGWELLTATNEIRVFVVPEKCHSEHMERWSRGGCTHRCDMVTVHMWQGEQAIERPCICDPDKPECALMTRLQFGLSNVPLLGIWRLNSKGKIFSSEVRAEIEQMQSVGMGDKAVYCVLSLRQQEIRKNGKTSKFAVPGITIDPNPPDFPALLQGMTISGRLSMQQESRPQIEAPTPSSRQIEAPAVADYMDVEQAPAVTEAVYRSDPDDMICSAPGCGTALTKAQHVKSIQFHKSPLCPSCIAERESGK